MRSLICSPSTGLREALVNYCLRVIDQHKFSVQGDTGLPKPNLATEDMPSIATAESIAILDTLCSMDATLAPRLFPTIKKVLLRKGPPHPGVYMKLLAFFLNHSEKAVHDPDPVFRAFFETYLADHCI